MTESNDEFHGSERPISYNQISEVNRYNQLEEPSNLRNSLDKTESAQSDRQSVDDYSMKYSDKIN